MKLHALVIAGVIAQVVLIKHSYACKSDSDCKGDRVCDAEKCVAPRPAAPPPCHQDTDCKGNDICEQSVCVAPAPQAPTIQAAPTAAQAPGTAVAFAVATPAAAGPVVATPASPQPSAPVAEPAPMVAPYEMSPPQAAPGAPPAPVAPGAPPAPGQPVATAQSGSPAVPPQQTTFKSATLLVPDLDKFYGVSINFEEFVKSWRGPSMSPTYGAVFDTLVYTGGGDAKAYMQAAGMTLGIRPSNPSTVSFALRAGAMVTLHHYEYGNQKSDDFDLAFVASGDLMIGYLTVGAQGWIRDNSLWMLRAGFAW